MRLILLTIMIVIFSCSALAIDKVNVGDVPPSLVGRTMDGKEVELSEMRGKVVVVTFWATWCAPCMAELPILHGLQQQVSPERLQIVAINFGQTTKEIAFTKDQLDSTNILFTHDRKKQSAKEYGIRGIPHMVIVDHTGKVAHIHVGYGEDTQDRLVDELNALLRAVPVIIENPVVMSGDRKAAKS